MKNIVFIVLFFLACTPEGVRIESKSLDGQWLCAGIKLDEGYFRPYSEYLSIANGKILSRISGTWRDTIQKIEVREDSIAFPYRTFGKDEVLVQKGMLTLGKFYPRLYYKVSPPGSDIDSLQVRNHLLPGQWESKEEILLFEGDSLVIFNKAKKDISVFCWDLQSIDEYLLLQRKGSFKDCDYPYFSFQLIQEISKDEMVLEGWNGGAFLKRKFKRSESSLREFKEADFRLCNPDLYPNMNSDWYYFKYPQYDGGLYRLKQIYDENFVPVKTGIRDGLIRVEFIINCVGEIGRLKVDQLNFDYERQNLDPLIAQQVVQILQVAGNWIPAERRDFQVDTYKFLIFKIINGKIEEIYP